MDKYKYKYKYKYKLEYLLNDTFVIKSKDGLFTSPFIKKGFGYLFAQMNANAGSRPYKFRSNPAITVEEHQSLFDLFLSVNGNNIQLISSDQNLPSTPLLSAHIFNKKGYPFSFTDLKVGDAVLVSSRSGKSPTEVCRLTKTQIDTPIGKFRLSDGFQVGATKWDFSNLILLSFEAIND